MGQPDTHGTHQVRGACPHDCPDTCALITTVENGVAIKVQGNPDHPATGGVLCAKVSKYAERTHHADRLLYPLKRVGPKGSGQFERVSWDEALADIARRLGEVAADDPRAVLPYSYAGTMGLVQGEGMAARFFHRLGASLLDRTICASAGADALVHTLGAKVGMRIEAFAGAKVIVIWGSNAIGSNLHFWRHAQEAKRHGARLVCIDPRLSETAEKCHDHIALLPGTDAALALALMHEFTVNGWLDDDYIARHTLGWDGFDDENGVSRNLKERCLLWTPERAAAVCGIDAQAIRDLARLMGETARRGEPVAIRLNYGMQRVRGGGNAVRAVACLPALLGSWRHASGGLLLSSSGTFPVQRGALFRPDLLALGLAGRPARTINMSQIGDALTAQAGDAVLGGGPPVRALVVYNSNPVAVAPESGKVVQGFAREDLFTVVLEQFQTDTADYADYVLPATTQLEHWDIHTSYGHTDVLLNRPAIAPLGNAKPNTQVFRELAARMGLTGAGPADTCFTDGDETLCRTAFAQPVRGGQVAVDCDVSGGAAGDVAGETAGEVDGVSFDTLLAQGFAPLPTRFAPAAPFAEGAFPTPSGKCEFFSQRLADKGLDGLPDHVPNLEAVVSNPALAVRYPLAMISPPARNFLNSTFVNVQSLRNIEGEPLLELCAADATTRGIAHGDLVRVFNDRGSYHCTAHVSKRARPGVVNGLGVWWRKLGVRGTNVNEVTSQAVTDLGGGPTFYDCLVQVERVAVGAAPEAVSVGVVA